MFAKLFGKQNPVKREPDKIWQTRQLQYLGLLRFLEALNRQTTRVLLIAHLPETFRALSGLLATQSIPHERCGDAADVVTPNRALVRELLGLSAEPVWLQQVQGVGVGVVDGWAEGGGASSALQEQDGAAPPADACIVRGSGLAAVVLTADCLPILLAATDREEVAAIHAGWRGLAAGVIEATLARMSAAPASIHAWLGPAIGQSAFEVGPEVRAAFVVADPGAAQCFQPGRDDRWHADLAGLAQRRLHTHGITRVSGGDRCTVAAPAQFPSFRRDGARSGRMATLVWRSR